ncbi:MAG: DNA adenine methylase [Epsilonproteobacteria bacterium]|nr:DNA adenine methylase [Campylobacterota bacterium]
MRKVKPFLKWVGGKRNLLPQLLPLTPKKFNTYFEPFLGGGALFFELYNLGRIKKAYLFDKNEELINSYLVVKESPQELLKLLKEFQQHHSKKFYYDIRAWDRKKRLKDPLVRAARFIYLNKTCFNGLYRVNKQGFFNVPLGRYKNPKIFDEENILLASLALQQATLKVADFSKVLSLANKQDFIYFDPPYYPLNKTSNFTSYTSENFLEKEQRRLFDLFVNLSKKGVRLMESNSNTPFIKELYHSFFIHTVFTSRAINSNPNKRGKISEVVIRNYT